MDESYIELNAFLKSLGIAPTGGQIKTLIRSNVVSVNGAVETRNKRKLHIGDVVSYSGKNYKIDELILSKFNK